LLANPDRHLASAILATNRLPNPSPDSVAGLPRGGVGRFRWPQGRDPPSVIYQVKAQARRCGSERGGVRAVCVIAVLAIVAELATVTRSGAAITRSSFQFRYFRHRCSSLP